MSVISSPISNSIVSGVVSSVVDNGGNIVYFDNTFVPADSGQDPTALAEYDTIADGVTVDYQSSSSTYTTNLTIDSGGNVVPTNTSSKFFRINSANSDGIVYAKIGGS